MMFKGCGIRMRKYLRSIMFAMLVFFLFGAAAAADTISLGSPMPFGTWEQDGNTSNGAEIITWKIIAQNEEENSVCLLADKCLEVMPFAVFGGADWPDSVICEWLNGEFLENAFGPGERSLILPQTSNGKTQQIFIPDSQEWERLFSVSNVSLTAEGTAAAEAQSFRGQVAGYWLSDSADPAQPAGDRRRVVRADAVLAEDTAGAVYGVRPMLWMSLDAAAAAPTPQPELMPNVRQIPGSPNAYELLPDNVVASSYIIGKKSRVPYPPTNLIDGQDDTSWQFSAKGNALGQEYVAFNFSVPVSVDYLWIKNGYWKITPSNGHDQYIRNSRPRNITVLYIYSDSAEYKDSESYTLRDDTSRRDWQKISLSRHENVTSIIIRVDSIYVGTYTPDDVCISEVKWIWNP